MRVRTGRFEKLRSGESWDAKAIEVGHGEHAVQVHGAVAPPATGVASHPGRHVHVRAETAQLAEDRGPAMGRYPGDAYYSGGAWYVSTLAAAEFYFKLSTKLLSGAHVAPTSENARFRSRLALDDGAPNAAMAAAALARGDSFMRTVRVFTPESGELSEQFDRTTGAQTSAKRLTWSYAAFVTAAASRREACAAIRASRPYGTAPGRARQCVSQSFDERRTRGV